MKAKTFWWGLGLTINNLGSVKPTGHTHKTSDIHPKPLPELEANVHSVLMIIMWEGKLWVV